MSVVAVISNRTGFDVELRAALGPEGPDVGQIPVGPTASERMIVEALPASGDVVVLVGPDLPQDQALGLLELVSQMRPTAAPVLVAHPSPDVLRQALRMGARGVVAPTAAVSEIADEVQNALHTVMRLRENFAAGELRLGEEDMRAIATLERHRRYLSGEVWALEGGPYTLANLWDE